MGEYTYNAEERKSEMMEDMREYTAESGIGKCDWLWFVLRVRGLFQGRDAERIFRVLQSVAACGLRFFDIRIFFFKI